MKRFLLLCSLVGIAAVLGSWWALNDPGYVLISRGNTAFQMSLATAFLIALFSFFGLYIVLVLLRVVRAPGQWIGSKLIRNARSRARERTKNAYFQYLLGNFRRARSQFLAGAPEADVPAINYLLAANASQYIGDLDRAEEILEQAEIEDQSALKVILIAQAQVAFERGHYEQAIGTLDRIEGEPSATSLKLYENIYRKLDAWGDIFALLPVMRENDVYEKGALLALEEEVIIKYLDSLYSQTSVSGGAFAEVEKVWGSLTKKQRKLPKIANCMAALYALEEKLDAAQDLLLITLKESYHRETVLQLGKLDVKKPSQCLKLVAKYESKHGIDYEYIVTKARLNMSAQAWAQAAQLFENAFDLRPSFELAVEMRRLYQIMNDPKELHIVNRIFDLESNK